MKKQVVMWVNGEGERVERFCTNTAQLNAAKQEARILGAKFKVKPWTNGHNGNGNGALTRNQACKRLSRHKGNKSFTRS